MTAAEARKAGFSPPKRPVSKLVFAAWQDRGEAWMGEALYDTAKRLGVSDAVLSEAFVACEQTAKQLSESGRGSLYDAQCEDPASITPLCIQTCRQLDQPSSQSKHERLR